SGRAWPELSGENRGKLRPRGGVILRAVFRKTEGRNARKKGRPHLPFFGQFAFENPPIPPFFVPERVQFAMQVAPGGFLVTDGTP
ncbi:MAG: hypothetical protein ABIU29_04335, partial [Chthoniobacterales bacterium]